MPVTQTMVRSVLTTAKSVFPDSVVTVSHSWAGGEQSFSAVRTNTLIDPMWAIDGRYIGRAYMLMAEMTSVDSYFPQVGEIVRVANGDETPLEMVIKRTEEDPVGATFRLYVAQEWSV